VYTTHLNVETYDGAEEADEKQTKKIPSLSSP
jgi:hypothetical protein